MVTKTCVCLDLGNGPLRDFLHLVSAWRNLRALLTSLYGQVNVLVVKSIVILIQSSACGLILLHRLNTLSSFEAVAAVSDGLKAWEVLKSRAENIDLILTEVELPLISGYALLTLIMEHDICKNIPVISALDMHLVWLFKYFFQYVLIIVDSNTFLWYCSDVFV